MQQEAIGSKTGHLLPLFTNDLFATTNINSAQNTVDQEFLVSQATVKAHTYFYFFIQ